jgi:hypothetical protein
MYIYIEHMLFLGYIVWNKFGYIPALIFTYRYIDVEGIVIKKRINNMNSTKNQVEGKVGIMVNPVSFPLPTVICPV